ncbi:MAG: hypothetical protein ACI4V7_06910 [Succinivibrionaceae bacterium]
MLTCILKIPGLFVRRDDFLKDFFGDKVDEETLQKIINSSPIDFYNQKEINDFANVCITSQTIKASLSSAALGLPGIIALPLIRIYKKL